MRTWISLRPYVLSIVGIGALCGLVRADDAPPAKPAPHPTVAAERRIWLHGVERADVQQRLFERALGNARPRDILGIDEDTARKIVSLKPDPDYNAADSASVFSEEISKRKIVAAEHFVLRVQLADAGRDLPKKADEYLDALVREYQAELQNAWERDPLVTGPREVAERAERESADAAARIRAMRQKIANDTGRHVYETAAETRAAWAKLEAERQAIQMELVGKRARQEALVKAMKETSEDLKGKAAKDGVAEELEKVVKARESAYESAKQLHKSGGISQSELLEAEGKVAEARAKVLERRDLVAERSGGTILVDLNRELQSVVVTVAEAEARLAAAQKAIAGFEEARNELEELQQYEGERELRAAALARARDALADAMQKYPPPQLVVKLKSSEAPKDK
jgi:hypothetical protein